MTLPPVPASIQALQPYVPGHPIEEIQRLYKLCGVAKLASNENAFGPSPQVVKLLSASSSEDLLRYPDGGGFQLKQALAQFHGVTPDNITLGNGSNDILAMVGQLFLHNGGGAMFSEHAFAVYPIVAATMAAEVQLVAAADHGYDLSACLERVDDNTRVIFIANPNNPTGTFLTGEELEAFLESLPKQVVVVLDEAYHEYVGKEDAYDSLPWLRRYPNLIISRTFSKAYALAGLRVGYALASEEISGYLNRIRQPFNVNTLALRAAVAALDDQDWIKKTIAAHHENKSWITAACQQMGLSLTASHANFFMVELGARTDSIVQKLLQKGVVVRAIGGYGLPHHVRISVGKEEENHALVRALSSLL